MTYRNYHMCVGPVDASRVRWRCDYCGVEADGYQALAVGECTHKYSTCEYCGGCETTNECKPDCKGIAAIFADLSSYVVGAKP